MRNTHSFIGNKGSLILVWERLRYNGTIWKGGRRKVLMLAYTVLLKRSGRQERIFIYRDEESWVCTQTLLQGYQHPVHSNGSVFFRMHYKTVEKGTYFPISIQSPTAILPRYYQQLGQSYLLSLGGQHHDNFSHICTSWITDHYHCFQVGSGHHRHQTAHLSNVNEQQQ